MLKKMSVLMLMALAKSQEPKAYETMNSPNMAAWQDFHYVVGKILDNQRVVRLQPTDSYYNFAMYFMELMSHQYWYATVPIIADIVGDGVMTSTNAMLAGRTLGGEAYTSQSYPCLDFTDPTAVPPTNKVENYIAQMIMESQRSVGTFVQTLTPDTPLITYYGSLYICLTYKNRVFVVPTVVFKSLVASYDEGQLAATVDREMLQFNPNNWGNQQIASVCQPNFKSYTRPLVNKAGSLSR